MIRLMGIAIAVGLFATNASAGVEDLVIQSQIGDDGVTVEFVVSNPDDVAYRCSSIQVDTKYSRSGGNPPVDPWFSVVEDVVIEATKNGQLFRQAAADVDMLRERFPLIEQFLGFGQIRQFCAADEQSFAGTLVLDDHSSCGDQRTLSKIYSVDVQSGRFSRIAPPAPWLLGRARLWASPRLPVVYAYDETGAQPILHAMALTEGALAPRGQLSLPATPSLTDDNGAAMPVRLAGATFFGDWLAVVYSPHPSDSPDTAVVIIDLVELDKDTGAPGAASRIELTGRMYFGGGTELFTASTSAGDLSLFLVPVPQFPSGLVGGVTGLERSPVDEFEDLHGRSIMIANSAIRIDVSQGNGSPEFTLVAGDEPLSFGNLTENFHEMVALRGKRPPEPSRQARIGDFGLALAPGTGPRDLQLLALQEDGGAHLLSDNDNGFCDARLLAVAPRPEGAVGVDVNATDAAGRSLLHYAAARGDRQKVERLLEQGADVSLADGEGFTPVMRAVGGNHGAVLELLMTQQADTTPSVPSSVGPPVSLAFYVVSQACDTCIAPFQAAGVSLDPVQTPQGALPFEQVVCSQYLFARTFAARAFPSDEMLKNMPEDQRDKLRAERDAYIAADTKEDRLERVISMLGLTCPMQ